MSSARRGVQLHVELGAIQRLREYIFSFPLTCGEKIEIMRSPLNVFTRRDKCNDTFKLKQYIWLTGHILSLYDSSDGAYNCFQSSPLWAVVVLPFLQQVLTAAEVGVFKEHPGPLQNLAGLDFLPEPFVLDWLYAFCQLQRLANKVKSFIQHQFVGPFGLKVKKCGQFDVWRVFLLITSRQRLTFLMILQDLTQSLNPIQEL